MVRTSKYEKTLNDDGRRRLRPLYGDGFGMIAFQLGVILKRVDGI